MDNLMYRPKVIDGQMSAINDIEFKKRLAKVRNRMEESARKRREEKHNGS